MYSLDLIVYTSPMLCNTFTLGRHTEKECFDILNSIGAIHIRKGYRDKKTINRWGGNLRMVAVIRGEIHNYNS